MKDEFKGIFSEFIRLKSKMYSLVDVDDKENKKAEAFLFFLTDKFRKIDNFVLAPLIYILLPLESTQ